MPEARRFNIMELRMVSPDSPTEFTFALKCREPRYVHCAMGRDSAMLPKKRLRGFLAAVVGLLLVVGCMHLYLHFAGRASPSVKAKYCRQFMKAAWFALQEYRQEWHCYPSDLAAADPYSTHPLVDGCPARRDEPGSGYIYVPPPDGNPNTPILCDDSPRHDNKVNVLTQGGAVYQCSQPPLTRHGKAEALDTGNPKGDTTDSHLLRKRR